MKRKIAERKRIRRAPRKGRRSPPAAPAPELNEASRAELGPDEEQRPYRPRSEDASIEDPLEDWPED
jgi:hypothetical protein